LVVVVLCMSTLLPSSSTLAPPSSSTSLYEPCSKQCGQLWTQYYKPNQQGPISKRKVPNGCYNKYICHPHTICIKSCLYYSSQIKKIIKGFFLVHNINFNNQIPTLFKCTMMAWYPCNLPNSHLLLLRSQSQMISYKMSNKICSTFGWQMWQHEFSKK
jgi:hypothetical protein